MTRLQGRHPPNPRARIFAFFVFFLLGCTHHTIFVAGMVESPPRHDDAHSSPAYLVASTGERFRLTGRLGEEVARVPGGIVRVRGRQAAGHRLVVQSYEIIDAGRGMAPHVGILEWDFGRLVLRQDKGAPKLELIDAPPSMRESVGARLWVVGPIVASDSLQVLDFGILRPARR